MWLNDLQIFETDKKYTQIHAVAYFFTASQHSRVFGKRQFNVNYVITSFCPFDLNYILINTLH